jgi:DNA integrity scanning protein DisA with diadenylate cyclase activity
MKIGLFLAVNKGHVDLDETILCLSGVAGSSRLDTLLVTNPHRDHPWFRKLQSYKSGKPFPIQTLVRLLEIALRLATEGREGKAMGTIFVVGDPEQLEKHTRQLILNPCRGHPRNERNIYTPPFFETLRELTAMDGAFIVSSRGVVESAGTYLDAPVRTIRLRAGLGARHAAAAALTAATEAVTVVLSQSSGAVTVFHAGRAVLELERPKPFGREPNPG